MVSKSKSLTSVKTPKRSVKPRRESARTAITAPLTNDAMATPTLNDEAMETVATNDEVKETLTPYQRMRKLLAAREHELDNGPRVISTVEALQEHLKTKVEAARIVIRLKLLWISDHTYSNWKLVRLHFIDAEAPESLDDMLSVFKAPYEANHEDIDSLLLTVTMWNIESDSDLLPSPGSIVDITEYSNLQLYRGKQCQLTAKLTHMSWQRFSHRKFNEDEQRARLQPRHANENAGIYENAVDPSPPRRSKFRASSQMTKRQGSQNYSEAEKQHLLTLVQSHTPTRAADWKALADVYNLTKDQRWTERQFVSLKRKYRSLRQEKSDRPIQAPRTATREIETNVAVVSGVEETSPSRQSELCHQTVETRTAQPTGCPKPNQSSPNHRPVCTLFSLLQLLEERDTRSGACSKNAFATLQQELHSLRQEHQSYRRTARRHHKELRQCLSALEQAMRGSRHS